MWAVLACAIGSPLVFAAESPQITIAPLTCVPGTDKNSNAKVTVTVNSSNPPASVRLYFVAEGEIFFHEAQGKLKDQEKLAFYRDQKGQNYFHPDFHSGYHYHEMRLGKTGEYWTMLPKVAPGTTGVTYHAVVTDADGHQFPSQEVKVPVTPDCPAPELSRDEKKYAANLVEGLTAERQSAVPPGFICDGIVNFITVSGDLRENEECKKCVCGIAPVEWLAGGAVLAGGGVIIGNQNHGGNPPPVSQARP